MQGLMKQSPFRTNARHAQQTNHPSAKRLTRSLSIALLRGSSPFTNEVRRYPAVTSLTRASTSLSERTSLECRSGSLSPTYFHIRFWRAISGWSHCCMKVQINLSPESPRPFSTTIFPVIQFTFFLYMDSTLRVHSAQDSSFWPVNDGRSNLCS